MKSLLEKELKPLLEGQTYQSETDTPLEFFEGEITEVLDFDEFFSKLTQNEDWGGGEEDGKARKFAEIRAALERRLTSLTVLKFGTNTVIYYVVGLDEESRCAGIKFRAVET